MALSMVKGEKVASSSHVKKRSNSSATSNLSKWTVSQCKQFLDSHGAIKMGVLKDLRERCLTISRLNKLELN